MFWGLFVLALGSFQEGLEDAPAGSSFTLQDRRVTVRRREILRMVENEYSRRFVFDRFENPKLRELREWEGLEEAVASGRDEFGRQVLLLDWTYRRFRKFGRPTSEARGALEILKAVDEGHTFFCAHYGDVLVSAAASLGWVCRLIALRRPDHRGTGSTEHTTTEIWSNQHRRWVMFDPTFALYVEREGTPLNAWEIRDSWFNRGGRDLVFVMGAERKRTTVSDLPVFRARHAGFGDLTLGADTLDKYAFLGYIPNTDLMDAGKDYARMFISKDEHVGSTVWHRRDQPRDPAREPYFPLHAADLSIRPGTGFELQVTARTFTPNFRAFRVRVDGGEARESGGSFSWRLHAGLNRLKVTSANKFGVEGPPSVIDLEVAP
ncbi:MAG: hypothetical protein ACK44W_01015 [Planctomycetota bacterium]